jgi:hypothetical protein
MSHPGFPISAPGFSNAQTGAGIAPELETLAETTCFCGRTDENEKVLGGNPVLVALVPAMR